jgi:PAS domain S-box-containing protein
MDKNPTYEELEQKIKELEEEAVKHSRTEEVLRQSEERYRTILEVLDVAYFEVDLEGNYTFVNDRQCSVFGSTREEMIGMNSRVVTLEEELKIPEEAFGHAYQTGEPVRDLSYKMVGKDGAIGFTEVSAVPVRNKEGEIVGFRGIGRDVTEQKQVEERIRQYITELEHKSQELAEANPRLKEKTEKLERMNKLFVDRELRMKELKEEVKKMKKKMQEGGS